MKIVMNFIFTYRFGLCAYFYSSRDCVATATLFDIVFCFQGLPGTNGLPGGLGPQGPAVSVLSNLPNYASCRPRVGVISFAIILVIYSVLFPP